MKCLKTRLGNAFDRIVTRFMLPDHSYIMHVRQKHQISMTVDGDDDYELDETPVTMTISVETARKRNRYADEVDTTRKRNHDADAMESDTSFNGYVDAILRTLKARSLYRARNSGDIYHRLVEDQPFAYEKLTTVPDILAELHEDPTAFGVERAPPSSFQGPLIHRVKHTECGDCPFLRLKHDLFGFTNGVVQTTTQQFVPSADMKESDRYIIPRRAFSLTHAEAVDMTTPHFAAFLASQFGEHIEQQVLFLSVLGRLLCPIIPDETASRQVFQFVVRDLDVEGMIIIAILRRLTRSNGLIVLEKTHGKRKLLATSSPDLVIIKSTKINANEPLLKQLNTSEDTIPFVFIAEKATSLDKVVPISLSSECGTLASNLDWVEAEAAGIAVRLIQAKGVLAAPELHQDEK